MKLTAELLMSAPSYINPIKDRELLLRGYRIPIIENLAVTKDLNDTIDLTDNDIRILGNFPRLTRLTKLTAARNRISYIQPDVGESLPNLDTLILNVNSIKELADIDYISEFKKLDFVSFLDNPVTLKPHYRLYIIWRNPNIRILDYQKVKDAERQEALRLFGTLSEPTALASQLMGQKTKTFSVDTNGENGSRSIQTKLTEEEKEKLRESLKNATSLAEMDKIEKALRTGYYG